MSETMQMPGSTVDEKSAAIRWFKVDERTVPFTSNTMRRYRANIHDGILIACVSRDPVPNADHPLWHVSVSHRSSLAAADGGEIFTRCPNWDEMKSAKFQLVPDNVAMVIYFPQRGAPYVNAHKTTLHLWECDAKECL
jgi:hypothetical protein